MKPTIGRNTITDILMPLLKHRPGTLREKALVLWNIRCPIFPMASAPERHRIMTYKEWLRPKKK